MLQSTWSIPSFRASESTAALWAPYGGRNSRTGRCVKATIARFVSASSFTSASRAERREVRVRPRVVAERAQLELLRRQVVELVQLAPDEEERRAHVRLPEDPQRERRVRPRPVVERERDVLAAVAAAVDREAHSRESVQHGGRAAVAGAAELGAGRRRLGRRCDLIRAAVVEGDPDPGCDTRDREQRRSGGEPPAPPERGSIAAWPGIAQLSHAPRRSPDRLTGGHANAIGSRRDARND